jgi:hypothetical protein
MEWKIKDNLHPAPLHANRLRRARSMRVFLELVAYTVF